MKRVEKHEIRDKERGVESRTGCLSTLFTPLFKAPPSFYSNRCSTHVHAYVHAIMAITRRGDACRKRVALFFVLPPPLAFRSVCGNFACLRRRRRRESRRGISNVIIIDTCFIVRVGRIFVHILGWQLSNCGFFLENQRQFFHGTK